MKLIGEYEITDNGVLIEGQITDSHIHEVRKLLAPFKTSRIYRGEVENAAKVYHVPHIGYRKYIRKNFPSLISPATESAFVKLGKSTGSEFPVYYDDASTFHNNMGVMYGDGEGRFAMDHRRIYMFSNLSRQKMRLLTNSAWVWTADERGNFKIEIEGMINKHIMTVLLSNATTLAKYIDTVLVKLTDHADKFTEQAIAESQAQPSRRIGGVWYT